jgi:hypothetical protein
MALWRGSACIYVFATVHNPLVSYDTDESKHHDLKKKKKKKKNINGTMF